MLKINNGVWRKLWSSAGVSNTRPAGRKGPARCVCAARDIIKITQFIAKTMVFCSIKAFWPPIVARGVIFPQNVAREPFFVKMWPSYETEFETAGLAVEHSDHDRKVMVLIPVRSNVT
jgi:hypothetical protein